MKILLSPAKRLNLTNNKPNLKTSTPFFIDHSKKIIEVLRELSVQEIQKLMKLSPDLASLNFERYQNWTSHEEETYLAAWLFDGEVYKGFHSKDFDNKMLAYIQENVIILSGLYGILKPLDAIYPYRLEMGTKLNIENQVLYKYWQNLVTNYLKSILTKDEFILNLSSAEYNKAIDKQALDVPIIDIKFKDYRNDQLKQINVYFKKARGLFAAWCAENNIQCKKDLIHFTGMGYNYADNLSDGKTLVFIR